ncbi:tryptophan synthase beta subunit-like PLP-dependent enzyme [Pelagophyceae sp. CCMP2097]|nr:tryptophan synthase beta subunit-like PLP-dependent enzyme [Pelagophyceae sp. CCMP2097]
MRFVSTRGGGSPVSFEDAIGSGYAVDGGLYVPETLPQIDAERLESWADLDYAALAFEVLSPFISAEVEETDLRRVLAECYAGFDDAAAAVPVVKVSPPGEPTLFVAELFHGPTYCFKDLGLQVLIRLLAHFSKKRNQPKTLLVSTTGDTGPAALRAARDVGSPLLRVVCFFPEDQVSALQRKQMTTMGSLSTLVMTFQGGGDDMDGPLKKMAMDSDFARAHGLCGINSYNVCRPLAQMVHYVWIYLKCRCVAGDVVDIIVPTGAMGNLAAATLAVKRGVPLGLLAAGVNENDITHRTLSKGEFHRAKNMVKTLSDAINIQVPYNFERVLYYALDCDSDKLRGCMETMDETQRLTLDAQTRAKLAERYRSARVDDGEMMQTLRKWHVERNITFDPHTSVALHAAEQLDFPAAPRVACVLATAHACKFEAAVVAAIGPEEWDKFARGPLFPKAARALMLVEDAAPLRLARKQAETLEDAQRRWEATVRAILEDPAGLGAVSEILDEDDFGADDFGADAAPATHGSGCVVQ